MKYVDADKLREKIEFSKSVYSNPRRVVHGVADAFRQDGRAAMCDDILKKLDSLQQDHLPDASKMVESEHIADVSKMMEQQEVELEKEVINYFEGYWPGMETAAQCNTQMRFTPPAIMRLVRHFFEYGRNAGKEKLREELLEWLNGKLTIEGATEGFVGGYDSALKDVIDKLNSL